jgi:plasmid maintenance system antidote protein VapI
MAVRLAAALDMTPEFWLNAQQAVDLYQASEHIKVLPRSISKVGQSA